MVLDPVCKMKVDEKEAAITSTYKGTKYYFRAQAKNSAGTASGPEMEFLTKPEAPVDGTFTATPVNGSGGIACCIAGAAGTPCGCKSFKKSASAIAVR